MVAEGVFSTGAIGSYCTADDVIALLAGLDTSGLGDASQVRALVEALLPSTAATIDGASGRDFGFHRGAEFVMDGTGNEVLSLAAEGAVPIVDVASVVVDGVEVLGEVVVGRDESSLRMRPGGPTGGVFRRGRLNVRVVADWGWTTPPSDIITAQAKLAAAELVSRLSPGQGDAESVRIGDYEVRYGSGGMHGETIRSLTESALRAAGRYRAIGAATV